MKFLYFNNGIACSLTVQCFNIPVYEKYILNVNCMRGKLIKLSFIRDQARIRTKWSFGMVLLLLLILLWGVHRSGDCIG